MATRILRRAVSLAVLLLVVLAGAAAAQTHVRGYTRKDGTYVAPHERKAPTPHYGAPKSTTPHAGSSRGTSHERRSEKAKHDFEKATGHPHGWKGHVVDHIVPLACGGADDPSNMQWQTVEEGKAKDKTETQGCK